MKRYCLFVCGISTFVGYLMPNQFLYYKQFYFKQFGLAVWPLDRAQSSASTPDQSWLGSDDNEEILHIAFFDISK